MPSYSGFRFKPISGNNQTAPKIISHIKTGQKGYKKYHLSIIAKFKSMIQPGSIILTKKRASLYTWMMKEGAVWNHCSGRRKYLHSVDSGAEKIIFVK